MLVSAGRFGYRRAVAADAMRHAARSASSSASSSSSSSNADAYTNRPLPLAVSRERSLQNAKAQHEAKSDTLDAALCNSLARRGAFTEPLRQRLDVLRKEQAKLAKQDEEASMQKRDVEGRVVALMNAVKQDPDNSTLKEELQMLRKQGGQVGKTNREDRERRNAILAESLRIRLSIPNHTHPDVATGDITQARIAGFGGDLTMLPDSMQEWTQQRFVGAQLHEVPALDVSTPDLQRDHLILAEELGWLDTQASLLVTGPSWPFLLGPLAMLEHALVNYAMDRGVAAGFTPVVVPDTVKRDIVSRMGFSPREGEVGQIYWIQADGKQHRPGDSADAAGDLALAATAEITLGGLCAGSTYKHSQLPIQLLASSHAFRAEAGARGHESRGLYRVHQFTKVEMFVICDGAESDAWLERLRGVQQDIIGALRIPHRVLDMPTEELGASAYRKYDVEAWMPGRGCWGEISSTSNCTDFQSRRLRIQLSPSPSSAAADAWPHTLNGTAIAVPRMIVALMENYGVTQDKRLRLPAVLRPYWTASDRHNVDWIDASPSSSTSSTQTSTAKDTLWHRSLERVRQVARRSGTDPASMVLSFMVLHELTAIVPLVLLFYLLGLLGVGEAVMRWLLDTASVEDGSAAHDDGVTARARVWLKDNIREGVERAERYGRRKGYFGYEQGTQAQSSDADDVGSVAATLDAQGLASTFANAVAAYALVKLLLPVRLAASVGLAGPFARVCMEPVKRLIRRRKARGGVPL